MVGLKKIPLEPCLAGAMFQALDNLFILCYTLLKKEKGGS